MDIAAASEKKYKLSYGTEQGIKVKKKKQEKYT